MDPGWVGSPPDCLRCVLCNVLLPRYAERFFRHLIQDHRARHNLKYYFNDQIICALLLNFCPTLSDFFPISWLKIFHSACSKFSTQACSTFSTQLVRYFPLSLLNIFHLACSRFSTQLAQYFQLSLLLELSVGGGVWLPPSPPPEVCLLMIKSY